MDWDLDHVEDDAAEALAQEALEAARSVVRAALAIEGAAEPWASGGGL